MRAAAQTGWGATAPGLHVGIRIAVPPEGLGGQLMVMRAWLDATCGAAGWSAAPAGSGGVRNDALALSFADAAHARAFVARFCCGYLSRPEPTRSHPS